MEINKKVEYRVTMGHRELWILNESVCAEMAFHKGKTGDVPYVDECKEIADKLAEALGDIAE